MQVIESIESFLCRKHICTHISFKRNFTTTCVCTFLKIVFTIVVNVLKTEKADLLPISFTTDDLIASANCNLNQNPNEFLMKPSFFPILL